MVPAARAGGTAHLRFPCPERHRACRGGVEGLSPLPSLGYAAGGKGLVMAFAFETLLVYQKAVAFTEAVGTQTHDFPRGCFFLPDPLDRAGTGEKGKFASAGFLSPASGNPRRSSGILRALERTVTRDGGISFGCANAAKRNRPRRVASVLSRRGGGPGPARMRQARRRQWNQGLRHGSSVRHG
jgi:hypothetical protein